jgi:hypothetical protein
MATLGRSPGAAPLTSADIPDNSITTAKIVDDNVTAAKIPAGAVSSDVLYLENNTSTQELSGTFATGTERLYFNDLYTLTGDLTIQENAHLALGTIADKDVLIEADTGSTERKITGEGTLDSGNVLQDTHRTSLTDMTGTLGSVVTGSPNLNLGNATFPAGHVLQVVSTTKTDSWAVSSSGSHAVAGLSVAITPRQTSNKILVQAHFCARIGDYGGGFNIFRNGSVIIPPTSYGSRTATHVSAYNGDANVTVQLSIQMLDSSLPSGELTYQVYVNARSNSTYYVNRGHDDTNTADRPRTIATITAMEVEV